MPTASARDSSSAFVCGRASASTTKRFDARLRGAAGEQHPLDDRGALVEHRRVRGVEPGEVGDHRLEVDERLEPALRDLGLVRRVRRVPARVLEHVALDDRGRDRAVVAEADHRRAHGVLLGERAQLGERLALGRGGRDRRVRAPRAMRIDVGTAAAMSASSES